MPETDKTLLVFAIITVLAVIGWRPAAPGRTGILPFTSLPAHLPRSACRCSLAAVIRATNANVISALTLGRSQILYRGHGSSTGWVSGWDWSGTGSGSPFTAATRVNALTNTVHPILYSIACQNGRMNQNDCIGEVWMSRAGGGAEAISEPAKTPMPERTMSAPKAFSGSCIRMALRGWGPYWPVRKPFPTPRPAGVGPGIAIASPTSTPAALR